MMKHRSIILFLVVTCALAQFAVVGQEERHEPAQVTLSDQVNLASLLDLCAEQLDLNIDYDPKALRPVEITLRLGAGVSNEELWLLTNQLLVAHDYTTIRMPGASTISVVKFADAAKKSEVLPADEIDRGVGYSTAVICIRERTVAEAIESIKPLISEPGGRVIRLGKTDLVLISDVTARLTEILQFVEEIDQPPADEVVTRRIELNYVDPTELVALVKAAVEARNTFESRPLPGELHAALDGDSVILVCPSQALRTWLTLITEFDSQRPVETRTYLPKHFGLSDVAELIEKTARLTRGGSGESWGVVQDSLSGSLIITATIREHERIAELMRRLEQVPPEARRPVRSFVIRNRDVAEIKEVLEGLLVVQAFDESAVRDPAATGARETTNESPPSENPPNQEAETPIQSATSRVQAMSPATGVTLTADEETNTLVVIAEPRILEQLEELVASLDVRQPQVELEVIVLSLSESDAVDLGVELQKLEITGSTLIGLSSLFGLSDLSLESDTSPLIGGSGFSGVILSPGDFSVVVRALRSINQGATRSYPKVLINNNEQATLDSVLQQPLLAINSQDTVATTSFAGTQDAGTQVSVTPHIAEGDHLILEYTVALSSFVGESAEPTLPPPRQQTSLQSVVTIPDSYTIAVGGLEIQTEAMAVSQIPFVSNIPLLGELFKSRSRSNQTSQFYVFIRANILRHNRFEDLKYMSDVARRGAELEDDWPVLEPLVIR